jgi:hypothetical protein
LAARPLCKGSAHWLPSRSSSVHSLLNSRYAIVTDGWSKRAAQRGAALINVNICPDDGFAMFWKVVDTSGKIKENDYVVQLHKDIRVAMEKLLSNATFLGYAMDSTATNVAAMKVLQEYDPSIVVLPCAAHALSNLIKHAAKFFSWVNDVYMACCSFSDKLIDSQKLRTALHALQIEEYEAVRGIGAHSLWQSPFGPVGCDEQQGSSAQASVH